MEKTLGNVPSGKAEAGRRRFGARVRESPRLRVVVVLVLVAAILVPALVFVRLCADPLDVSGTTRLPGAVAGVKRLDELAYPAHVVIGTTLGWAGCDPVAVGLQWLKAGGHARTPDEVSYVSQGLRYSAELAGTAEELSARLCHFIPRGFSRLEQQQAFDLAGLRCESIPRLNASGESADK